MIELTAPDTAHHPDATAPAGSPDAAQLTARSDAAQCLVTASATTDGDAATTSGDPAYLDAIAQAYAAGDALSGEQLLTEALDRGLPWDHVCAAAARGVARRYGGPERD